MSFGQIRLWVFYSYIYGVQEIIPVIWETVKALCDRQRLSEITHQSDAFTDHLRGIRNQGTYTVKHRPGFTLSGRLFCRFIHRWKY